ncbi:MAG: hypothetical protein H6677_02180 [Candidatus Obscuribacterales bacterium]|nr:hypothetical protein [Candidatus Obscuribacterales bacterium]
MSTKTKVIGARNGDVQAIIEDAETEGNGTPTGVAAPGAEQPDLPPDFEFPEKGE